MDYKLAENAVSRIECIPAKDAKDEEEKKKKRKRKKRERQTAY